VNLTKIRSLAKGVGVKPAKKRKADLIRSIQRAEEKIPRRLIFS